VNRFRLAISSPPSLAQTPHLSRYDWIRFRGAGHSLEEITPRQMVLPTEGLASLGIVPADPEVFDANNPVAIVRQQAAAVRSSGLRILLEAGSLDAFNLHEGAEFLHRSLWELDIPHEYHHTLGGGHLGRSLGRRLRTALAFIGGAFRGTDDAELGALSVEEQSFVDTFPETVDVPGDPLAGRQNPIVRLAAESMRRKALGLEDEQAGRTYGRLPELR
jgi:hypothetical protein